MKSSNHPYPVCIGKTYRYFALMLVLLTLLGGCSRQNKIEETRFMMGTLVKFTVLTHEEDKARQAINYAAQKMQSLSNQFTLYGDRDNPLKQFNRSKPGTPIKLPAQMDQLLREAVEIEQQTQGAFSPSLGSLSLLWGFSNDTAPTHPPAAASIERLQQQSQQCLRYVNQRWLRGNTSCQIDLGGIAKGFIIDQGIDVLKRYGIHHALINAGGDIRILGTHGDRAWSIGIRHPRRADQVIAKLSLSGDISVVTSGDYERFFIDHEKRYHHILDPASGWPATACQSATVIASSAAVADAWSTALFVLGRRGIPLLERAKVAGMIVDQQGRMLATPSFKQYLQHSEQNSMIGYK